MSELKDVTTPVPHVPLSITLAEPTPSGSTNVSRLCQGCSHPHRHHPAQSGSGDALLRPRPLRTGRATFIASGSSKPLGRFRFEVLAPGFAGLLLAPTGGMDKAGLITIRRAG